MAASEQGRVEEYQDNDVLYIESEESDSDYDSDSDPSYCILEDTHAKFSNLSMGKKSKSRIGKDLDENVDEETVKQIIEAGPLEKLKVEQCKVYLRKNGLRLSGKKCTLIQRIKEHLDIINGEGEKKYPVSSFVLNCKGDACTGDVVMFEQNVYGMFNIASCSAGGPRCGNKRIVAGRIVKESYGEAKQQHTFTIEVLWSKGEKPLPPLHPLLIKGRNLYRLNTMRQRWEDENERLKVLMEKHSRGSLARSIREARIQEKEKRKMRKKNRESKEDDPRSKAASRVQIPSQQPAVPQKPIKSCGRREFHPLQCDNIFFAGRTNNRQPLMSMNNFHPTSLPPRQGSEKQKMCRYDAKGRCYFGDNCKFSHDLRWKL